jgi:hypothetical protein
MAFRLQQKGEPKVARDYPVTIQQVGDGGRVSKHAISVTYEMVKQDEIDALTPQGDIPLLARVIIDWKGIQGDDGEALPCTEDTKDLALQVPHVRSALLRGFFEAISGGARKN